MAAPAPPLDEKTAPVLPVTPLDVSVPATLPPTQSNGMLDSILDVYRNFQEKRASLGLPQPGTVDGIAREVQRDVLLTNQTFSGLRAELNKSFSISPL